MNPHESTPSSDEPLRLTQHSDPAPRPEPRSAGVPLPPVILPRRPAPAGPELSNKFTMDDFKRAPVEEPARVAKPSEDSKAATPQVLSFEEHKARHDEAARRTQRDPRTRPELFGPEPVFTPQTPQDKAFELLRTNPHWIVLGIVVILTTILMIPRSSEDSVAKILKHSAEYDGQTVKVRGRVGEMFEIAGGHVYYLHQGRDTIVVFTRATPPDPKKDVVVTATVSTGYMDGRPRLALFEN